MAFIDLWLSQALFRWRPNFKQAHYMYIVGSIIVGSIIMYPMRNTPYIDILFTSVASCTQSGLNTKDLNLLELYQQIVIYIIATTTTPIVIHGAMLFLRLYKFEQHFQNVKHVGKRRASSSANNNRDLEQVKASILLQQEMWKEEEEEEQEEEREAPGSGSGSHETEPGSSGSESNETGHGSHESGPRSNGSSPENKPQPGPKSPNIQFQLNHPKYDEEASISSERSNYGAVDLQNSVQKLSSGHRMPSNYLSYTPTVGTNSAFIGLTPEQKEELGGVEYRAVKLLIKILIGYYIGFHLLALVVYVSWINSQPHQMQLIRDIGISPNWWGAFIGQSAFNNLGYSMTPNSLLNFSKDIYPQVWGVFFIVCGHTGFPVMLRFIIWSIFKLCPEHSRLKEDTNFLLDHPRRVFTFLFPSIQTWYLVGVLVILNGLDLLFFMVLDLNNDYLQALPVGNQIMCGIFQAFTTRTAGLSVLGIGNLETAVQVSYMVMMYVSVLPVAISIRKTNVYEDQALGIYRPEKPLNDYDDKNAKSFLGTHIRKQLGFDLWFIALGCFIICIADADRLRKEPVDFNVFKIFFELFSAYGTVGLSLGYKDTNPSFSGQMSIISKLVICATMIRGRHRGLPYSLDRSIMLPGEKLDKADENENWLQEVEVERDEEGRGRKLMKVISKTGDKILNI